MSLPIFHAIRHIDMTINMWGHKDSLASKIIQIKMNRICIDEVHIAVNPPVEGKIRALRINIAPGAIIHDNR